MSSRYQKIRSLRPGESATFHFTDGDHACVSEDSWRAAIRGAAYAIARAAYDGGRFSCRLVEPGVYAVTRRGCGECEGAS